MEVTKSAYNDSKVKKKNRKCGENGVKRRFLRKNSSSHFVPLLVTLLLFISRFFLLFPHLNTSSSSKQETNCSFLFRLSRSKVSDFLHFQFSRNSYMLIFSCSFSSLCKLFILLLKKI